MLTYKWHFVVLPSCYFVSLCNIHEDRAYLNRLNLLLFNVTIVTAAIPLSLMLTTGNIRRPFPLLRRLCFVTARLRPTQATGGT